MPRLALLLVALALAGCRSQPEPSDMKPDEAYQKIANELPRADFGWGAPSGLAELAASSRADRPQEDAARDLSCDERSMKVVVEVFRPKLFRVPYSAFEEVSYTYELFPNLLFCIVFPVLQVSEMRVVFDGTKVLGFFEHCESECRRLEQISREVGMAGPWEHAQAARAKLADDEKDFGHGKVSLHFTYVTPIPPFIPWTAEARRAAEAFLWAKAHPQEPPR